MNSAREGRNYVAIDAGVQCGHRSGSILSNQLIHKKNQIVRHILDLLSNNESLRISSRSRLCVDGINDVLRFLLGQDMMDAFLLVIESHGKELHFLC